MTINRQSLADVGLRTDAKVNDLSTAVTIPAARANTLLLRILAEEACAARRPLILPPAGIVQVSGLDFSGLPRLHVIGQGSNKIALCNHVNYLPTFNAYQGFDSFDYLTDAHPVSFAPNELNFGADAILPNVGDCLYNWDFQAGAVRSPRALYRVLAVDTAARRVSLAQPLPDQRGSAWKRTRGRAVVGDVPAGSYKVTLADPADAALFVAGRYACVTDGSAVNELFCEFPRVAAVQGAMVFFHAPLMQGYESGLTSLIPGAFNEDMTFEGFGIGAPNYESQSYGYLRGCPGLRINSVVCDSFNNPNPKAAGGPFSCAAATDVEYNDLVINGVFAHNCAQHITARNLRATQIGGEEFVLWLTINNAKCAGIKWGVLPGSQHTYRNVVVSGGDVGVSFAPYTIVELMIVSNVNPATVNYWNCDNLALSQFTTSVNTRIRGNNIAIHNGRFTNGLVLEMYPYDDEFHKHVPSSGYAVLSPDTVVTDNNPKPSQWTITQSQKPQPRR
jgi:hypothetical protein